jgi:hypothetical protein
VIIAFPQHQIVVPDFGNIAVTINADGMMAVTLSNFASEVNPGAANAYIQAISAPEAAFVTNPLAYQDYANLIAAGVCALYFDRQVGWQWIQGVTAANSMAYPTRVPIKRRRMADEIEDTLGDIAAPYLKQPATTIASRRSSWNRDLPRRPQVDEHPGGPAHRRLLRRQRLGQHAPTSWRSGSTSVKMYVKLLASMDYIEYIATIGETVTIPISVAAAAA